jgi:hypothetical protein
LSTILHRSTQKHLCWHSITKILGNGPKAHFPFSYAGACQEDPLEKSRKFSHPMV